MTENLWTVVERFSVEPVMVEISRAAGRFPRFSIRVGWKNAERQGPWIPVAANGKSVADIAGPLIASAEAYVADELEKYATEEADRLVREKNELEHQREINAAKKQKYLQNKDARREENRRHQKGGGKK